MGLGYTKRDALFGTFGKLHPWWNPANLPATPMYKFILPLLALVLLLGCSKAPQSDTPSVPPSAMEDITLLQGKQTVTLATTKGDIVLELSADIAPKTVTNFVTLAQRGFYNNLTFHRVIPGFMIQGGDPKGDGTGGESIFGETFEDEINEMKLVRGVIAMANRGPNTNGSQFFIVHADATPWLDGRHTAFGKVTEGMDVLDAIAQLGDESGKPSESVTFTVEVAE